jgi:hypothetical protein
MDEPRYDSRFSGDVAQKGCIVEKIHEFQAALKDPSRSIGLVLGLEPDSAEFSVQTSDTLEVIAHDGPTAIHLKVDPPQCLRNNDAPLKIRWAKSMVLLERVC